MANCWQVPPIKFNLYPNRWRRHSLPFHLDADTVDFHALDNHPNQDRQGPGARGPASSNFVRAERFFSAAFFVSSFDDGISATNRIAAAASFKGEYARAQCVTVFLFFLFLLFFSFVFSPRCGNEGYQQGRGRFDIEG